MKITITTIAMMCHRVNREWCKLNGDDSQPRWGKAEDWQKESAINGVKFRLDNPNATPEDQHTQWCADKDREGWVYGSVKDEALKIHPCLVPYRDLPIEHQIKDHLFKGVVEALKIGLDLPVN